MRLLVLILVVLTGGCASSGPSPLKSRIHEMGDQMAVAFEKSPTIQRVAVTAARGDDADLSLWCARELESNLVERERVAVLDRSDLTELLAEHELVLSDIFDDEARVKIGSLVGADALIIMEIQPNPDGSAYALRGRLVALDTGRIMASHSSTLESDELGFGEGTEGEGGGFFAGTGNVLLFILKLPATPVGMFFDIFETTCVRQHGVGSRMSVSYPERVCIGLWDGIPFLFPWAGGVFYNKLYLTRTMWNSWF